MVVDGHVLVFPRVCHSFVVSVFCSHEPSIVCFFFTLFPLATSDGVKGKTWGPSTVHQKERAHIRPVVETEGQRLWSRSAPNLEKTQRGSSRATAAAIQNSRPSVFSASCTLENLSAYMSIYEIIKGLDRSNYSVCRPNG